MASSDIDCAFIALANSERFKDAGLARGRGVVDDVLVYEVRISAFDFGADASAELRELAEREDLILYVDNGEAILRQRPSAS
jgi:hypothetical protein